MIYLNTDTIHSIRRGLELGGLLELPYNVSFNGDRFAEILAVEGCLRPFNQLRYMYVHNILYSLLVCRWLLCL